MNRHIFTYLKHKGLTDINVVNRLFLSAFMRHYNLVPQFNSLLVENYINDEDEDAILLFDFIGQLKKYEFDYAIEELNQLFEFVISPSDRMVTGAIYTPAYIRERIVYELTEEYDDVVLSQKRFADISCGCGGFFLTVAVLIHTKCNKSYTEIYKDNIFGIDIQGYSLVRTKLILSLLALINGEDLNHKFNLYQDNTLSFDFSKMPDIDVIIGNPPYVCARNMSEESRGLLANWRVCASGNSDLYIPFFQIAIEKVKHGGKVGFITMNTFMTSLNGRALREYFHEKLYSINIVDFRGYQMFPGKNTYTCLFFLRKQKTSVIKYCTNLDKRFPSRFMFTEVSYNQLNDRLGWKLNLMEQNVQLEHIGIPLGEFCQTRHGIATLANKVYVFKPNKKENGFYYFTKDGVECKVEQAICKRIVNSNKFNSKVQLEDIMECVIYPYQTNDAGKAEIFDEDTMKIEFPLAYAYLLSYRSMLDKRDKGHTEKYPTWYAYGRTQSLILPKYKLFFPKIANKKLNCIFCDNADLLLYNGLAFVSDDPIKLFVLKRILDSEIFWHYIQLNSKPYSSGYYSLNGISIKQFGIIEFNEEQIKSLLNIEGQENIDKWLTQFYG